MKTSVMKKSLLDYAIKGFLSTKFRKNNPNLNALDEIEAYNVQILKDKKIQEKELKNLESSLKNEKDKEAKQNLKAQITALKRDLAKLTIITPLTCHSEALAEESQRDISHFTNAQYDKTNFTPPFAIPESWVWVRLGDISNYGQTTQINPKYLTADDWILELEDIEKESGVLLNKQYFFSRQSKSNKIKFNKGDILFGTLRPYLKKIIIANDEGFCSSEIMPFTTNNNIRNRYIAYFLMSDFCGKLISMLTYGTRMPRLGTQDARNLFIPLPPLAEQKEIVKILDQLMDLANEFERTQENLKRIEKRIEKSLLKFAIKGNLSKCYRKDNPTLNALDEIEAYNVQILKDKQAKEKELKNLESTLKKEKDKETKQNLKSRISILKKEIAKIKIITPLDSPSAIKIAPPNEETNLNNQIGGATSVAQRDTFTPPFEIPPSWVWVKLGEICEMNPKNQIDDELEVSFIPMTLIADGFQNKFSYESKKWKEVKNNFTHLCENSVAFAKITPCFQNGKAVILKNLVNGYGAGTTELIILLPNKALLKEYLFYCINSPIFVDNGIKNFKGTAGQQRISTEFVQNFPIPLPPLEEQKEIVKVLDSLFTLAKGLRVE